jgi:hypothetical protein
MTTLAVIFMSTALLFVVVLAVWCYYQILKKPDGG